MIDFPTQSHDVSDKKIRNGKNVAGYKWLQGQKRPKEVTLGAKTDSERQRMTELRQGVKERWRKMKEELYCREKRIKKHVSQRERGRDRVMRCCPCMVTHVSTVLPLPWRLKHRPEENATGPCHPSPLLIYLHALLSEHVPALLPPPSTR